MARKDLAGLAALGALGMMLSKRKSKEGTAVDPESADRANAVSRGRTDLVDTGMSTPEPGAAARPDENYGNEGRRTGPVGVGKVPTSPSVPSRPSLASQGYRTLGGFHPEYPEDSIKAQLRDRADQKFGGPIDNGPAGSTYKKGGAVKKMASGGMASSASKRADGIATKGKTRGKMC